MSTPTPRQKARHHVAEAFLLAAREAGHDGIPAYAMPTMLGVFDMIDFVAVEQRQDAGAKAPEPEPEPEPAAPARGALKNEMDAHLAAVVSGERVP